MNPDDADYQRLWRLVNENNAHRYTGYQPDVAADPGLRSHAALTPSRFILH